MMWRTRAVLSLLYEEVAGVRSDDGEPEEAVGGLERARRRARLVVGLDWAALLVLLLLSDRSAAFLTLGPTESTAFSLAILAVAVHSGFRLGQLEKLNAVARAGARLVNRDPEA